MKYLIGIISVLIMQSSIAGEIYTCKVNGGTVYQGKPCAGSLETIGSRVKKQEAVEKAQYQAEQKQKAQLASQKITPDFIVMGFSECKKRVLSAQLAVAANYKTSVIINTPQEYIARICTNDGSVLMTCSGRDGKLITTQSSYCS